MSFTLIGKHEKDSRANRDGYVEAMLEMMAENPKLMHVDCDLMGCINTGKLLKAFPAQTFNAASRSRTPWALPPAWQPPA